MKTRKNVIFLVMLFSVKTVCVFSSKIYNPAREVRKIFLRAAEERDVRAIDKIFRVDHQLVTMDIVYDCCEMFLDYGYSYPLKNLLKHAQKFGRNIRVNALLIKAVQAGNKFTIKNFFECDSYFIADRVIDICYRIAAENKNLVTLYELSRHTKNRVSISINSRFTNFVIAKRLQKVQEILNKYSNQLAACIVNMCYVIAAKNGNLCIAFQLSNHQEFRFKAHWIAWKKTAFRENQKMYQHIDYMEGAAMILRNIGVSVNMIYSGVTGIFKN